MRTFGPILAAVLILAQPCVMWGTLITSSPNPSDLGDLDHGTLWTWRIAAPELQGHAITSATLTIASIYNWQQEPNRLFIHLFDTVPNAGTAHRSDPNGGIQDYFLTPSASFAPAYGPSNITLTSPSFAGGESNMIDWVYTFTPGQVATLSAFVANNGDFAFGFDPDCHFYNSGITFNATASPEPSTALLVGSCLLLASFILRRFYRPAPAKRGSGGSAKDAR